MSEKIFFTSPDGKSKIPFDADKIQKVPYNQAAEERMKAESEIVKTAEGRGDTVEEERRPTSEGTASARRIMPKPTQ